MDIDTSDPATACALALLSVAALLVAIGMDMRKLPFGRVKMMPWTLLTIFFLFGVILSARNLVLVMLPAAH